MRALTAFACLVALTSLYGCKAAPVDEVCTMEADCWLKDCEWTDAACNAQVEWRKQECEAESRMILDSLAESSGESCTACEEAQITLLDCLDAIDSCARFDNATHQDGECYQEANDAYSDCEDIENDCFL